MFERKRQISFFYLDHLLEMRQIRGFRIKVIAAILAGILLCLGTLLTINFVYYNFLGLGHTKLKSLTEENRYLHDKLAEMTVKYQNLEQTVGDLNNQGDQLRLLVDLPSLDEDTKGAGTGGDLYDNEISSGSNSTMELFRSTERLMKELTSQVNVQKQSYSEILRKAEYNEGYFKAIPAIKPMDGYYSPYGFGIRIHPILGTRKVHLGLDIVNDVGTPVYCAGDGIVHMAGQSGGGLGIAVVIDHGYGYQTVYAHLSKVFVHAGQKVQRGDLIAKCGKSGLVTGPHLHYEVRKNGVSQNPMDYFFDDIRAEEYKKIADRR
jgi:murein DD-endopeptidase MepM/ murein hydrolase activator NlpD